MAAIVATDIVWRYTSPTGPGNSTAVATTATGATSLGTFASSTAWAGGGTNDLFPDITGAQNAAALTDYKCVVIHNSNAANAYQNAVAYISSEVAGGAVTAIGADTTAASTLTSATAQTLSIAAQSGTTSQTAPAGVTFSSPTTAATGVALGSIPVGNVKGLWIRRSITANTTALSADGVTLATSGDTGSL
jgi:hypothetical protein